MTGRLYELRDLKGVTEIQGGEGGSALSKIEASANGKSKSPSPSSPVDPHLPPAPPGFEFRSLNRGGSSTVVDAEYVAGRYYALPDKWRSREQVDKVLGAMLPQGEIGGDTYLPEEWRAMTLAGLSTLR